MSQYVPDTPTCLVPQPAPHPNLPHPPKPAPPQTCCSPLLTEPLHDCIDDGDALVLRKVIANLWGQAALPLASASPESGPYAGLGQRAGEEDGSALRKPAGLAQEDSWDKPSRGAEHSLPTMSRAGLCVVPAVTGILIRPSFLGYSDSWLFY